MCALIENVRRDLPEQGVAPWVSANDKPMVLSKPVSGNAAEQRLKTEVMQLPPRDRRRLKEVPNVSARMVWNLLKRTEATLSWIEQFRRNLLTACPLRTVRSHRSCLSCSRQRNGRVPPRQADQTPRHRPRERRGSEQNK